MANEFGVFLKIYYRRNDPTVRYMVTFTKQDGELTIDREFSDMIFERFDLHEVFFGNIGGNYMMMMEARAKAEEVILEKAYDLGFVELSDLLSYLYDRHNLETVHIKQTLTL